MRLPLLITAALIAAITSTASAHDGARVHVGVEGGQIKTYLGTPNTNDATSFAPSRIFVEELPEFSAGIFLTDFPGFEARSASGIPTPTTFSFSIAGPLKFFDYDQPNNTGVYKTVQELFTPVTPQIAIRLNASNPWAISSTGPVTGHDFFTHNANGDHGHVFFGLFGNGTSFSDGPDGVYALPLALNDSGGGLTSSETFWILFHKEAGTPELNAAITASPSLLIPEPATIGLLACGFPLLAGRRRRAFTRS